MPVFLTISLIAVFVCIAVVVGFATSRALEWAAPERRRIRELRPTSGVSVMRDEASLVESPAAAHGRLSQLLPKSPKELSRLRRNLIAAGQYDLSAAIYYSAAKIAVPVALGGSVLVMRGFEEWFYAVM